MAISLFYCFLEYLRPSDDSTFDTVFQSVTGDTLILRVHWPPTASGMVVRPPAMTLAGVEARHPWLDYRMRIIGYAPIQSSDAWSAANVLLGGAVHAVIQHLQLNPPTILRFVDAGLSAIQTKPTSAQPASTEAANGVNRSPPPPAYHESMLQSSAVETRGHPPSIPEHIDWPKIPPHFDELDALSRDRLEELMKNELEFRAFTNQLDIMKKYNAIQQEQLSKNVAVAQANLQYESEIEELHKTISKLQHELQAKVKAFQALEKKQDLLCQPPPVAKVIRDMTKAKKEAYAQSERIATQWLQTAGPVDDFLEEFMAARKVQHVRAAKLELLERNSGGTYTTL
jgi:Modifier of rudimentary (Mod(r)) protein